LAEFFGTHVEVFAVVADEIGDDADELLCVFVAIQELLDLAHELVQPRLLLDVHEVFGQVLGPPALQLLQNHFGLLLVYAHLDSQFLGQRTVFLSHVSFLHYTLFELSFVNIFGVLFIQGEVNHVNLLEYTFFFLKLFVEIFFVGVSVFVLKSFVSNGVYFVVEF